MTLFFSGDDQALLSAELDEAQRDKLFTLIGVARSHLCLPYVEATFHYLQERSGLLDLLTDQLINATDQVEVSFVRNWLADTFEHNGLWVRLGEEVWVNVLAWTVQDLDEPIAASTIQSLAQEPFRPEVWEALFHPDLLEVQSLLQDLIARLAAELLKRLQEAIAPHQDSTLETSAISSGREAQQTQAESLWVGGAMTNGPTDPPIRLTHVLSRSEDFRLLPWELMAQLQQQGGYTLVQLVLLLVAHGMRQSQPQEDSFTLRATDVLEQLDWPTSSVALTTLLQGVEQVGAMTISSVWMLDAQGERAEAFQVWGRPWEILTDLRGNLDWKTGHIDRPDLVLLTVRPGLWLSQVLEAGAMEALNSFEGFARLALSLLKLDFCRDPFLVGLFIYLMRSVLSGEDQFSCFSVQELLEAVLLAPARQVLQDPSRAISLFEDWNRSLESLQGLGWTPDLSRQAMETVLPGTVFYVQPCPAWLSPVSDVPKPLDWIEQWLACSVVMALPLFGEGLRRSSRTLARIPLGDRSARKLRFDRLTGSEIRSARKAMRLTQAQLAQALHVHQSLVAKIEAGRRSITEELELSLRSVLQL